MSVSECLEKLVHSAINCLQSSKNLTVSNKLDKKLVSSLSDSVASMCNDICDPEHHITLDSGISAQKHDNFADKIKKTSQKFQKIAIEYMNKIATDSGSTMGTMEIMENTVGADSGYPEKTVEDMMEIWKYKPQVRWKNCIDNSADTFFVPNMRFKHNSVNSNEIYDKKVMEYQHPYEDEIKSQIKRETIINEIRSAEKYKNWDKTECTWVDELDQLEALIKMLKKEKEFAIKVENHSLLSFCGYISLVKISTANKDFLVDAIKLHDHLWKLNEVASDGGILKVLFKATDDVLWLQRDFSVYLVNIVDIAEIEQVDVSLEEVIQNHCKIESMKKDETFDWRKRPLPKAMVEIARYETRYLLYIKAQMLNRITGTNENEIINRIGVKSNEITLKKYQKPSINAANYAEYFPMFNNVIKAPLDNYVLYSLLIIRDKIARQEDLGVEMILGSDQITEILKKLPSDRVEFDKLAIPKKWAEIYMDTIFTCYKSAIHKFNSDESLKNFGTGKIVPAKNVETISVENEAATKQSLEKPAEKTAKDLFLKFTEFENADGCIVIDHFETENSDETSKKNEFIEIGKSNGDDGAKNKENTNNNAPNGKLFTKIDNNNDMPIIILNDSDGENMENGTRNEAQQNPNKKSNRITIMLNTANSNKTDSGQKENSKNSEPKIVPDGKSKSDSEEDVIEILDVIETDKSSFEGAKNSEEIEKEKKKKEPALIWKKTKFRKVNKRYHEAKIPSTAESWTKQAWWNETVAKEVREKSRLRLVLNRSLKNRDQIYNKSAYLKAYENFREQGIKTKNAIRRAKREQERIFSEESRDNENNSQNEHETTLLGEFRDNKNDGSKEQFHNQKQEKDKTKLLENIYERNTNTEQNTPLLSKIFKVDEGFKFAEINFFDAQKTNESGVNTKRLISKFTDPNYQRRTQSIENSDAKSTENENQFSLQEYFDLQEKAKKDAKIEKKKLKFEKRKRKNVHFGNRLQKLQKKVAKREKLMTKEKREIKKLLKREKLVKKNK